MKKWPWWAWLAIGTFGGVAAATALLEWTRIDHAAIWSADLAMQGWFGAVLGSIVSVVVALVVLRTTIRDERDRSDRQMFEERERSDRQLAADRERLTEQLRHERERLVEQLRHERELAAEGRRAEAWAAILQSLAPIDRATTPSIEVLDAYDAASKGYWAWRMHLGLENQGMADAVWDTLSALQDAIDPEDFDKPEITRLLGVLHAVGALWHSPFGDDAVEMRETLVTMMREEMRVTPPQPLR